MTVINNDIYKARSSFELNGKTYTYYRLQVLEELGMANVSKLPYSIKILLESVLRQYDGKSIQREHIENLCQWGIKEMKENIDVPFKPARIVLQDFTGVPVIVDLASLRNIHDFTLTPRHENYSAGVLLFGHFSILINAMESNLYVRFCGGSTLYKKLFGICLVYTPMSTLRYF